MVAYSAKLTKEDGRWLIEFPDCPGCQTFAETEGEVIARAREALEGWLEATLEMGRIPPQPPERALQPGMWLKVVVAEQLALGLRCLWNFRQRIQCLRLEFGRRASDLSEQGRPNAAEANDTAEKLLGSVVREFSDQDLFQSRRQTFQKARNALFEMEQARSQDWVRLGELVTALETATPEDVAFVAKAALDLEYQLTGDTAQVGPLADLLGVGENYDENGETEE